MRQHHMFLTDFHSLQQRAAEARKDCEEISPDFLVWKNIITVTECLEAIFFGKK